MYECCKMVGGTLWVGGRGGGQGVPLVCECCEIVGV